MTSRIDDGDDDVHEFYTRKMRMTVALRRSDLPWMMKYLAGILCIMAATLYVIRGLEGRDHADLLTVCVVLCMLGAQSLWAKVVDALESWRIGEACQCTSCRDQRTSSGGST